MGNKLILAVDTGGTFTDFVLFSRNGQLSYKLPSTPLKPEKAILQGIKDLNLLNKDFSLIHGTTVGTNAFLEGKGSKVALISTKGFSDIIDIGRQNRLDLYDIDITKPVAMVKNSYKFCVHERIDYRGVVVEKLNKEEVIKISKKLKYLKIDSIAVSLLFSYKNNKHEKIIRKILEKEFGSKCFVTVSSDILPEYREYERTIVTVLNSYLGPTMSSYLKSLANLSNAKSIHVMQSNGGVRSLKTSIKAPVHTLLSGPAAGVYGAYDIAKKAKVKKIITFDMGGTSTDVCLVDGKIKTLQDSTLGGMPIKLPMIPIHTVGAGGGSIAWIDAGGLLKVGPESTGAEPGPACYGLGKIVTITDANLFLGRIHPSTFLAGRMKLDEKRAKIALEKLARGLGVEVNQCALGIVELANLHMENAIRVISLQKGHDPRDFTLIPFGGAGGLHACEMAINLGIVNILFPYAPGLLSAYGAGISPIIKDFSKTVLLHVSTFQASDFEETYFKVQKEFEGLIKTAKSQLRMEDIPMDDFKFDLSLDMRFVGQSFEINIPFSKSFLTRFNKEHKKSFGFIHHGHPKEIVTIRLKAKSSARKIKTQLLHKREKDFKSFDPREIIFQDKKYQAQCFWRDELAKNVKILGPAIICEYSSTIFIPPKLEAIVDSDYNIRVKL